MKHEFHATAPHLQFKMGRHVEYAQAWYVHERQVYVNWCGSPTAVQLTGTVPDAECYAILSTLAYTTGVPDDAAHWLLAQDGLLTIDRSRFGLYCTITPAGKAKLDRMSGGGSRATSQVAPAPVKKLESSHPEATAGPADAGASCEGAAPRSRRKAAKQAEPTPDQVQAAIKPPAAPLEAGAPPKNAPGAPLATRSPGRARRPSTDQRSGQTLRAEKRVVQRVPGTSSITPNAVRVTVGAKVTYYPLSMFEALNGTKHHVRTVNKLYRAYPLAASVGDLEVRG